MMILKKRYFLYNKLLREYLHKPVPLKRRKGKAEWKRGWEGSLDIIHSFESYGSMKDWMTDRLRHESWLHYYSCEIWAKHSNLFMTCESE